ncbi:MAG: DUF1365 domain-containing protein [Nitrosomonadales bacterium]|jgi:hypothetical protein|nr:DUF1365 domain-containing protein [Nitrosomonadales bacterium]MBT5573017.1 DUF1365 domain-containing protein [Nitrosomonadales bacterium]
MHSIYKGTISHSRTKGPQYSFSYRTTMLFLDLDEIKSAFNKRLFWSYEKPNLASFRRKDFFGDTSKPIKQEIIKLITKNLKCKVDGRVFLLTTIRYFGYCFNPVSFYYCYNKKKELTAIVSHITNTPWGERHAYVHDCRKIRGGTKTFKFKKDFYVSPFLPMDLEYIWKFTEPKDFLFTSMECSKNQKKYFTATLKMTRQSWSSYSLNKLLFLSVPMGMKTIISIYWNALILYLKKVKFYPHA